jgi:hypothetical protein
MMSESNETQKPLDLDLRERIAAVLIDHPDRPDGTCHLAGEGDGFDNQQEWAEHVADAVIRELPLIREDKLRGNGAVEKSRYVTPWKIFANE